MSERVRFGRKQGIHVHYKVKDLARDLCMASYEAAMANNIVRTAWKARHPNFTERQLQVAWLCKHLAAHVAPARAVLAGMLSGPLDDDAKALIHEALVLDNHLVRGRNPQRPPLA
jgi:hypothetical protein